MRNKTVDCSLAIKIKFSPTDSKSDDRFKGTIEKNTGKGRRDSVYSKPKVPYIREIRSYR